ncbi:MAG: hypothetical protein PHT51_03905 [Patescibacteria group bacterium]|nr:hypothetical protein [Patescibacteria group bacterium]MDD4610410.1 hypothetical protein [Patescibacteria group bacterium]
MGHENNLQQNNLQPINPMEDSMGKIENMAHKVMEPYKLQEMAKINSKLQSYQKDLLDIATISPENSESIKQKFLANLEKIKELEMGENQLNFPQEEYEFTMEKIVALRKNYEAAINNLGGEKADPIREIISQFDFGENQELVARILEELDYTKIVEDTSRLPEILEKIILPSVKNYVSNLKVGEVDAADIEDQVVQAVSAMRK